MELNWIELNFEFNWINDGIGCLDWTSQLNGIAKKKKKIISYKNPYNRCFSTSDSMWHMPYLPSERQQFSDDFQDNGLNFGLFLTNSYCMAFEDVEYGAKVVWNTIVMLKWCGFLAFWDLTAPIPIHCHYMENGSQDIFKSKYTFFYSVI